MIFNDIKITFTAEDTIIIKCSTTDLNASHNTLIPFVKHKNHRQLPNKSLNIPAKSGVDTSTIHEIDEKIEYLERGQHVDTRRYIEEISKCKPHFPIPLHSPKPLREGERVHIECRVEPVGDPTLTLEWFFNGKPLPTG